MNFALNEEQSAIQEMALSFAKDNLEPKAIDWDEQGHFPVDVVKSVGELGLGGIYVREDVGGSGLGRLDAVLIFEALAHGCPTIGSFVSIHNMVAWMVDSFGSEEQRQKWVPKLCSMEMLASYCLTEPGTGSDSAALKTKAEIDGNQWKLNGTKSFISGAGHTDLYLAMVRTGEDGPKGISAMLIEKDTKGISFGAEERKMGWKAQPTADVRFDDCKIPTSNLLGEEGKGFKYAMAGLDGGRLNIAASALGAAQFAYNKSLQYAKDRKAFGKSIADFQALQFKLAEMATDLEVARTFLYKSAWMYDQKSPDASRFCAMAKLHVTDVAFKVANQALQIHGGYGYLADFGIEKIVRDLRVHQILEGTNEIMRVIISRQLLRDQ